MLVQDVMQTKLVTVSPETTLPEAIQLTAQRGIRHLPVLTRHMPNLQLTEAEAGAIVVFLASLE